MKWEKTKIKDFTTVITGGTPSTTEPTYWEDGNIPWLNSGELNQETVIKSSNFITEVGLKNSSTRLMPADTVLIALTGATTGKTAYLTFEACANQSVTGILPSSYHNPKYLYYYLTSIRNKVLNDAYGGAQKHISQQYVKEIEVPLPPLHIQEQIADTLDKADVLRRKDQELLTKYDELAQAIFYDMFGDPVKNEKGWQVGFFGDFISVLTDYHSNGSYETLRDHVTLKNTPDYALMVRTTDLEKNNFTDNVNYITKEAYEHLEKSKVFGGEIIINKIGSAGNIYLMPFLNRPVSLGMNAFLVRLKDELNPVFAYYFLNTDFGKYEISKRVFGAVTKTITKDAVRSIPMFITPKNKQDRFVQYITSINILINKGSITNSSSLFQSLLQKYFS